MSSISAEEWELVSAFEVQPEYVDSEDPWPYTDALFTVRRGGTTLTFAVAPAYRDVRITLQQEGVVLYELNAAAVVDVRYRRDGRREVVDVVLGPDDTLAICVRPDISLQQHVRRKD